MRERHRALLRRAERRHVHPRRAERGLEGARGLPREPLRIEPIRAGEIFPSLGVSAQHHEDMTAPHAEPREHRDRAPRPCEDVRRRCPFDEGAHDAATELRRKSLGLTLHGTQSVATIHHGGIVAPDVKSVTELVYSASEPVSERRLMSTTELLDARAGCDAGRAGS